MLTNFIDILHPYYTNMQSLRLGVNYPYLAMQAQVWFYTGGKASSLSVSAL